MWLWLKNISRNGELMLQTPDNLLTALASLPLESSIFSAEDISRWGDAGVMLEKTGLLVRVPNATNVLCPCGEHWGEVIRADKPPRLYVSCPYAGCEEIEPERLRRWKFNVHGIVQIICESLGLPQSTPIENGLWRLGSALLNAGSCELWFSCLRTEENSITLFNEVPESPRTMLIYLGERPKSMKNIIALELVLRPDNDGWKVDPAAINQQMTGNLAAAPDKNACIFRHEGEMWRLCFNGISVFMQPRDGLTYLNYLLSHPNQEISVTTLRMLTSPEFHPELLGNAGETSSQRALVMYRQRLKDIQEDMMEAEKNNDFGKQKQLDNEKQGLLKELQHSAGLQGRIRKASDDAGKLRKSIQKAISDAVSRIVKQHKELGAHLAAHIRTGGMCSYSAPQGQRWIC